MPTLPKVKSRNSSRSIRPSSTSSQASRSTSPHVGNVPVPDVGREHRVQPRSPRGSSARSNASAFSGSSASHPKLELSREDVGDVARGSVDLADSAKSSAPSARAVVADLQSLRRCARSARRWSRTAPPVRELVEQALAQVEVEAARIELRAPSHGCASRSARGDRRRAARPMRRRPRGRRTAASGKRRGTPPITSDRQIASCAAAKLPRWLCT